MTDPTTRNTRAAAALHKLYELGQIQSPWRAGMVDDEGRRVRSVEVLDTDFGPEVYVEWYDVENAEHAGDMASRPDTTDDLTVAALGLLAAEAWKYENAHVEPHAFGGWRCSYGPFLSPAYPTKADAWLEALERGAARGRAEN